MKANIIHKYLSNGLEVYLHPTSFAAVTSIQILVKVGSIDEEDFEGGCAHVLEHMLFKGTKKYPEIGSIAATVEKAGGDMNAYTTFDHTNYYLTAPSEFTFEGTELLLDVVQNSLLDEQELKKELEVVIEEIKRGRDNPNSIVSQSLFSLAYHETRLARPVIGYQKIVEEFSRETVFNFYKKWYSPNNMVLIAAGDFDAEKLLAHIENLNQNFNPISIPNRERIPEINFKNLKNTKPTNTAIHKGPWQEVRLQLSVDAPCLEDLSMPVWDVFSAVLGENDSSRLIRVIKEEKQLVTNIEASCYTPKYPWGSFSVAFFGRSENVIETLQAVVHEIQSLAQVPPSKEELTRVCTALKASRIYAQESVDGISRNAGLSLLTSAKMEFENQYINRVMNVTEKEVQNVATLVMEQLEQGAYCLSAAFDEKFTGNTSQETLQNCIKEAIDHTKQHFGKKYLDTALNSCDLNYPVTTSSINEEIKQIKIQLPQNKCLKINYRLSKRLPIASSMLVFRGGLILEKPEQNGISGLTATMLTRGTERQMYRKFVEELEDKASNISAFSGRDILGLRSDSLAEHFLRTTQMLLDCVFRPEFSDGEWNRLKKESLEIMTAQKDNPSVQLAKIVQPLLFPGHPYQCLSLGTEETVKDLTLEHVKSLWESFFAADEYIFSLSGDFELEKVLHLLEAEFSQFFSEHDFSNANKIKNNSGIDKNAAALSPKINNTRLAFSELNREQCHIMLCFRGVSVNDDRRTALELAANILAGQGGRLFLDLRDQKSLAYSVGASQTPNICGGVFTLYIATATHKTKDALFGLKHHIETLAKIPPSIEELERAKQSVLGARRIESQHVSYQTSQLAMSDAYGLGFDNFLKFDERVKNVTPESISSVLKSLLEQNPPVIAGVGSPAAWFPEKTNDDLLLWNVR